MSAVPPTWNFEPRETTPQEAFDEALEMWNTLKFDEPVLIGEAPMQSPMCWSSVYDKNGRKFKPNGVYRGSVIVSESYDKQKGENVYSIKVDTSTSGNPDSFSRVEKYQNKVSRIITEKFVEHMEYLAEKGAKGELSALNRGGKSFAGTWNEEEEACVKSFAYLKSMPKKDSEGNLLKDGNGKLIFEPVPDAPLRVGAKVKYNSKYNKWPTLNINDGSGTIKKVNPSDIIDFNNRENDSGERRPYCKLDARVSLSLAIFIGSHGAQSPFVASVSTKVVKMTGKFVPYESGDEITALDEDEFGGSVNVGASSSNADEDEFGGVSEPATQEEVSKSFKNLMSEPEDGSESESGSESGSDSPPPPPKKRGKGKGKKK